jgi:hypothetical protein
MKGRNSNRRLKEKGKSWIKKRENDAYSKVPFVILLRCTLRKDEQKENAKFLGVSLS